MKREAPAAERNRAPILDVLRRVLPEHARVLELGSGTGQHAAHFTASMPAWSWQPTERERDTLSSIEAYREEGASAGFLAPVTLDARDAEWPPGPFDAVFAANVIHIAPWSVCEALVAGASRALHEHGVLVLYGPFRFSGAFTADSNAAFDARLRRDDPEWGVRDVDDVRRLALAAGFTPPDVIAMPANNHVLVFRRA
jgi:SAM-dependent methyltransferase